VRRYCNPAAQGAARAAAPANPVAPAAPANPVAPVNPAAAPVSRGAPPANREPQISRALQASLEPQVSPVVQGIPTSKDRRPGIAARILRAVAPARVVEAVVEAVPAPPRLSKTTGGSVESPLALNCSACMIYKWRSSASYPASLLRRSA
jgi:hypothetical protein